MSCYLSFSELELECQGCTHEIPPGLVGWTDEILPGRLAAICQPCLDGLDYRLRGVQRIVDEAGRRLLEEDLVPAR